MESQDIKTTEELLQYVALHGDETTYSLFSVLLAGHTDDATKRRYFDDLRNRGLIKQEEEAA